MSEWIKIIERIYQEKDSATNMSVSICGVISLTIYSISKDVYISFICLIIFFPVLKVLIKVLINRLSTNKLSVIHSDQKIKVIDYFTSSSGCFLQINEFSNVHEAGLLSLIHRGFIEYWNVPGEPEGFVLDDKVYSDFLSKNTENK